jgi:hypothetical protein
MSNSAIPLVMVASAAFLIGVTISSGASSETLAASTASGGRPCQGITLSILWGDRAWDSVGECRPVRPARKQPVSVFKAPVIEEQTETCPNRKSYLGGALMICSDSKVIGRS